MTCTIPGMCSTVELTRCSTGISCRYTAGADLEILKGASFYCCGLLATPSHIHFLLFSWQKGGGFFRTLRTIEEPPPRSASALYCTCSRDADNNVWQTLLPMERLNFTDFFSYCLSQKTVKEKLELAVTCSTDTVQPV